MNPNQPCPECGKPLPAGSDVCPACLMAQAIASRTLDGESGPRDLPPPPAPEEIADKFPQFEILECLDRGGMGVVYKARQKSLNRLVAIKILAPERERDARFAGRFAKEAEMLAKLAHPHIVTIHDFGETGGLYYLVMEFINGVNLRDLLREGKMAPEQALAIVPPICEALQFAHDHGIVHRDIKPENILLDREGRVKIADFGIATLAGDAAARAGTPDYMAPEQSGGAPDTDHRADIYALGVVLYEMLTGERPTTIPVAPSRRVQIDVRLDEVVLRALAHQPERRFQSAGDFNTVLGELTRAVTTAPPRTEPVTEGPPVTSGETSITRQRLFELALASAASWAIALLATEWIPAFTAWCRSSDLTLVILTLALGMGVTTGLFLGVIAAFRRSTGSPDEPGHRSLAQLLHFAPALLLIAAWLTSGLEKGAVLILSVLVVAMLILHWIAPSMRRRGTVMALALIAGLGAFAAIHAFKSRSSPPDVAAQQEPPHKKETPPAAVEVGGLGRFPTLAKAVEAAPEKAVIRLGKGTYRERIVINKPVTLIGSGWESTRIELADSDAPPLQIPDMAAEATQSTLVIVMGGEVILEGLAISRTGRPPEEGIFSWVNAVAIHQGSVVLRKCALIGSPGSLLSARNASVSMEGCLLAAAWQAGISLYDVESADIRRCVVRNCRYGGIVIGGGSRQVTIAGNQVTGSAWHGIQYDGDCAPVITGNLIQHNAENGIIAFGNTQGEITGNVIVSNETTGIACLKDSRDRITRNVFVGNLRESIRLADEASPQIRGNIFLDKGIHQQPAGRTDYGSPEVVQNVFWNMTRPWERWTETGPVAFPLPEENRIEDPQLGPDFAVPAGSPLRGFGIRRESMPPLTAVFPIQAEEKAIIPDGGNRDRSKWKRPK